MLGLVAWTVFCLSVGLFYTTGRNDEAVAWVRVLGGGAVATFVWSVGVEIWLAVGLVL